MSPERVSRDRDARMRERLRTQPAPEADPAFRARLRAQFVSGVVGRGRLPAPRARARGPWRPLAAGLAAAAALVAAGVLLDHGPGWRLVGTEGNGTLEVGGHSYPTSDAAGIAERLRSGGRVTLPEGVQLDLELPGVALVQVAGGSVVELPRAPGRLFRRRAARLEAGEIRVATVPGGRGADLEVRTPEARASVTGTTYAVLRQPGASCVCVLEGSVRMDAGGRRADVLHGFRRSVYRDPRVPLVEPILPMEVMKLSMLRDRVQGAPRP